MMALQILVGLLQVPLALKYLGNEGYGLWALAFQVSLWLQLMDLGMNGALARYLIDYRHDLSGRELAKCIGCGLRIFTAQGLVVTLATAALAFTGEATFGLAPGEALAFRNVLLILSTSALIRFLPKVASAWLYASQRQDLIQIVFIVVTTLEFCLFWALLVTGNGIYAFAWSRAVTPIVAAGLFFWLAIRYADFPTQHLLAKSDLPMFRRLAGFAGGMFLLTLGNQLLTMSQTILASKVLGLTAAAVWATAPRLFQLVSQAVGKLWDLRIPYLSLLMATSERQYLTAQFIRTYRATAYIGGGAAGFVAAINPEFLSLWTKGAISWEGGNDLMMALGLYTVLLIRCFTDFVLHTKKVGWMPFLMLVEGFFFIGLSLVLLPSMGIRGMVLASLLIGGLLRLPYAWVKFRQFCQLSNAGHGVLLLHSGGGLVLGVSLWWFLQVVSSRVPGHSQILELCVSSAITSLVLLPIAWRLVLSNRDNQQS